MSMIWIDKTREGYEVKTYHHGKKYKRIFHYKKDAENFRNDLIKDTALVLIQMYEVNV